MHLLRQRRDSVNKFGLFVVTSAFAVLFGACGGGVEEEVVEVSTPTQSAMVSTATPSQPVATPTKTPISGDYVRISSVGLEAKIVQKTVTKDFAIPEPPDNDTVELIDFTSKYLVLGGIPGEGNAVLYGNYDGGPNPCNYGKDPSPCYAVMKNLHLVAVGDAVEIRWGEKTLTYAVGAVCNVSVDKLPGDVYERTSQSRVTLYSLAGDFNKTTGSYPSFVVIVAEKPGASVSCPPGTLAGPPKVTITKGG